MCWSRWTILEVRNRLLACEAFENKIHQSPLQTLNVVDRFTGFLPSMFQLKLVYKRSFAKNVFDGRRMSERDTRPRFENAIRFLNKLTIGFTQILQFSLWGFFAFKVLISFPPSHSYKRWCVSVCKWAVAKATKSLLQVEAASISLSLTHTHTHTNITKWKYESHKKNFISFTNTRLSNFFLVFNVCNFLKIMKTKHCRQKRPRQHLSGWETVMSKSTMLAS